MDFLQLVKLVLYYNDIIKERALKLFKNYILELTNFTLDILVKNLRSCISRTVSSPSTSLKTTSSLSPISWLSKVSAYLGKSKKSFNSDVLNELELFLLKCPAYNPRSLQYREPQQSFLLAHSLYNYVYDFVNVIYSQIKVSELVKVGLRKGSKQATNRNAAPCTYSSAWCQISLKLNNKQLTNSRYTLYYY